MKHPLTFHQRVQAYSKILDGVRHSRITSVPNDRLITLWASEIFVTTMMNRKIFTEYTEQPPQAAEKGK